MKKKIDRRPCRKIRSCWKLTYLYQTVVGCEPPLVRKVLNTARTQTNVVAVIAPTKTRTARNEIEVDFVGKTDAAGETVAENGFSRQSRERRKRVGRTIRVKRTHTRHFRFNRRVEHVRNHAVVMQRVIRRLCTTDQIGENRKLLKLQKNGADRRNANPASANQVKTISSPVMIFVVPHTHFGLDVLANERSEMRGDEMKRKLAARTMKLEKSLNDYTKGLLGPDEPRLTTETTFVNTKKRKRHLYLNN